MVRKLVAILFLSIFSFSLTEAGQLLKLPLLVEHFIDHTQKEYKESFADFIKHHYFYPHQDDGDEQEDNDLPFKNVNNGAVTTTYIPAVVAEFNSPQQVATRFSFHYQSFYFSAPLYGIFHPPRFA